MKDESLPTQKLLKWCFWRDSTHFEWALQLAVKVRNSHEMPFNIAEMKTVVRDQRQIADATSNERWLYSKRAFETACSARVNIVSKRTCSAFLPWDVSPVCPSAGQQMLENLETGVEGLEGKVNGVEDVGELIPMTPWILPREPWEMREDSVILWDSVILITTFTWEELANCSSVSSVIWRGKLALVMFTFVIWRWSRLLSLSSFSNCVDATCKPSQEKLECFSREMHVPSKWDVAAVLACFTPRRKRLLWLY